jgi:peptidyl-prolyl cis-trans isomerase C
MVLMKQFILTTFASASLLCAQVPAPSPAAPSNPPSPPGAASQPAVAPDKIVLSVGAEKITAKEFDSYIEGLPEQLRAQARGPMKRQMAEQIVRVKVLSQQARKQGLDQDAALKSRIAFQTENLLAGAAYADMLKSTKVDDAAVKTYFDEHKEEWDEVSARHILIKYKGSPVPTAEGKPELSEEQALAKAQEIRKKLLAGGDFAAIAKAESDDSQSGANGGELGSFKRNSMVPEFEKVAFTLPVGQVSEPVKTQFGYHLIRVDKHDAPTLDNVRSEIVERVKPDQARQAVEMLAKSTPVEMDDSYFGPAAPPPAMTPEAPAAAAPAAEPAKPTESLTAPEPPKPAKPATAKPSTAKPGTSKPKASPAK